MAGTYLDQVESARKAIVGRWSTPPRWAIILGSGLGGFADRLQVDCSIAYSDIPHFPRATAIGHAGRLLCGALGAVPVVAMQGRFHLYEGYSAAEVALPVRVLRALGADQLLVSNAAGGLHPQFQLADLMLIEDHVNLMMTSPLIGPHDDRSGNRFPDMSCPYDAELRRRALATARQQNLVLHQGVYAGLSGPTYETRAEYRMLRRFGADAAGMSTVPEVIAAVQAGFRVLGLSVITNLARPDTPAKTAGHAVIETARTAEARLARLVSAFLKL